MKLALAFSALLVTPAVLNAQAAPLNWRHVGGVSVNEGLAGLSGGAVRSVWYADNGARLLAQTSSGRVFETSDFEHWRLNAAALPDASQVQPTSRIYSTRADNVYASEDGGRTWMNVTGFNNRSVIGGEFFSVAVSPADAHQLTAANAHGLWRSLDGGMSWHGLNDGLPNLAVRKLIARRRVLFENNTTAFLDGGVWTPTREIDPETELRKAASAKLGLPVTAAAHAGAILYAGMNDGRIAVSRDGWATSSLFGTATGVAVRRFWVDPDKAEVGLAVAGGRVLRTVNGGLFWDDVGSGLPELSIHGIAADRPSGTIYLASDRGLYTGALSLSDAGPVAPAWALLSRDLPAAPVWDVRLNLDNTLTVAVDGYGVFETVAPHRSRGVRLVNGADMSDRAAAPGSLISIVGANVARGRVGDLSYPVLLGSDESSQLQVPFEAAPGSVRISLDGSSGAWIVPMTVKEASPSIFIDADGAPLLLDSSSGLVLDSKFAVHAGDSVQILATGLGRVTPDWPSGVPAPLDAPPSVRGTVTAFLDGSAVEVTRATLAPGYVGYYIVELRIPRVVNRGAAELRVVMNGEESNRVRLYVESDVAAAGAH